MRLNMKNHILLVEDDRRLADLVKDYLENNEFLVTVEGNGSRVIRQCQQLNPALVILDLMLPGKDGLTICQELRPQYRGPILMLTARNEDIDQVLGLEFGADDYALMRRYYDQENNEQESLAFDKLIIQPTARKVQFDGDDINLSSHEFDLLVALAKHAGQVIGREYLFNQIYNREYDGLDRTIDVRISQLRKKLFDNSENPTRIKTIWGKGYLFVANAWS
jgi:DNA-binding response OmpR family regulator